MQHVIVLQDTHLDCETLYAMSQKIISVHHDENVILDPIPVPSCMCVVAMESLVMIVMHAR